MNNGTHGSDSWKQFRSDYNAKRYWFFIDAYTWGNHNTYTWLKEHCMDSFVFTNGAYYFRDPSDALLCRLRFE